MSLQPSEVLGGEKREIKGKVWTVPGERMKAGKEHRVPLSAAALRLFEGDDPDEPLFAGEDGKRLSNMSMLMLLRRMGRSDLTVHGFRSSFRDWAAESTAYPAEVVEMALAHAISDKTEAAYRRGDLFEKRRRLMDEWATYCAKPRAKSATVVALRSKRG